MSFWDPDLMESWAKSDEERRQKCFKGGHVVVGASCSCGFRKAPASMSKPAEKHTAKFRKKPVVIEAIRYEPGRGLEDAFGYRRDAGGAPWGMMFDGLGRAVKPDVPADQLVPLIKTLEGYMAISPGDWIITSVAGERYPCKPDIFEATYEAVK